MGYERHVDFLDDDQIDENLKCAICFGVCEQATTACFSGHTFCAICLQRADAGASMGKCPTCRANKIYAPNRPLRGMIDALRVRCGEGKSGDGDDAPVKKKSRTEESNGGGDKAAFDENNSSGGCVWEGKLGDWRDMHLKECPFIVVQCPDCGHSCRRMDIEEHTEVCKWHKVECDLCHKMIQRTLMDFHKKVHCPQVMMECPFCGEEMTREELGWEGALPKQSWDSSCVEQTRWNKVTGHKAVCPKMMLCCEFDGCGAKFKREDGPKHHADNAQFHAALVNQAIDDLRHWDPVQMYWNIPRSKLNGSGHKVLRSKLLSGVAQYELYLKLYLGGGGDPVLVAICSDSINPVHRHRYVSLKNIHLKVARDCDEDNIFAKIDMKEERAVEIKEGEECAFHFSSRLKKYDDENGVSESFYTRDDLLHNDADDSDGEEVEICICASFYVQRHTRAFLSCDDD